MNKFLNWMETKFSPKMNKINHNIWVTTLKDSINQVMPLIFLGSIFSMLTLPGDIFQWEWWPNFWTPNGWTMGLISVMIAFLIPYNLMEKSRLRRSRIIGGISGLILYFIAITPQLIADKAVGFSHSAFGAGGMFIAILTGVIAGLIIRAYGKFSFFKEDSVLPDFIRAWFDQMLPVATVVVLGWIAVDILSFDFYNLVLSVFQPLRSFTETFWGFLLIDFITIVLYSMGISAWVLTPITTPIKLAAITANAAGAANVFTNSFGYAYMAIGGAGCTLGLAILMLKSKSVKLKALGRATIVPSIFNINEPVVFGAIAWNPILMIPMWLCSIASVSLAWIFTKVIAFAPIPVINFQLWYCPYPICTWLATSGALTGIILVFAIFAVTLLIYYPFFKVYEKQCINEEQAANKA